MSRLYLLAFAFIVYKWPKESAQWFLACIMAFVASYLTVMNAQHVAPLGQFEVFWILDYIVIQFGFSLLHKWHVKV